MIYKILTNVHEYDSNKSTNKMQPFHKFGGWSVAGRGLAGSLPDHDQQRSNGRTRGS